MDNGAPQTKHLGSLNDILSSDPLQDPVQEKKNSQRPLVAIDQLLDQLDTRLSQRQDRRAATVEDCLEGVSYGGGAGHQLNPSINFLVCSDPER